MNCLLCEKPFDKKGSRVHDLAWDTANKTYKKDENGGPKTYVLPLHRDCVWEGYYAQQKKADA